MVLKSYFTPRQNLHIPLPGEVCILKTEGSTATLHASKRLHNDEMYGQSNWVTGRCCPGARGTPPVWTWPLHLFIQLCKLLFSAQLGQWGKHRIWSQEARSWVHALPPARWKILGESGHLLGPQVAQLNDGCLTPSIIFVGFPPLAECLAHEWVLMKVSPCPHSLGFLSTAVCDVVKQGRGRKNSLTVWMH